MTVKNKTTKDSKRHSNESRRRGAIQFNLEGQLSSAHRQLISKNTSKMDHGDLSIIKKESNLSLFM
jgi:hypothetical protein